MTRSGLKLPSVGQRLVRGFHRLDLVAFGAQPNAQETQESRVVIDEQDLAFTLGLSCGHTGRLDLFVRCGKGL